VVLATCPGCTSICCVTLDKCLFLSEFCFICKIGYQQISPRSNFTERAKKPCWALRRNVN
jgi:hypothetical protein